MFLCSAMDRSNSSLRFSFCHVSFSLLACSSVRVAFVWDSSSSKEDDEESEEDESARDFSSVSFGIPANCEKLLQFFWLNAVRFLKIKFNEIKNNCQKSHSIQPKEL